MTRDDDGDRTVVIVTVVSEAACPGCRVLSSSETRHGCELLASLIDSLRTGVPTALVEVKTRGRTLRERAADVVA